MFPRLPRHSRLPGSVSSRGRLQTTSLQRLLRPMAPTLHRHHRRLHARHESASGRARHLLRAPGPRRQLLLLHRHHRPRVRLFRRDDVTVFRDRATTGEGRQVGVVSQRSATVRQTAPASRGRDADVRGNHSLLPPQLRAIATQSPAVGREGVFLPLHDQPPVQPAHLLRLPPRLPRASHSNGVFLEEE